jgi:hypothetical protein
MHNKKNKQLKLNKKTVILLRENVEKYRTGNQKDMAAALFTAGYPRCNTVITTVKPTKESDECVTY